MKGIGLRRRLREAFLFTFNRALCATLGLVGALSAPLVGAATITYEATDLPDVVVGQDLWEYSYHVSGTFNAFEGFDVLFSPSLYAALQTDPVAPNADWLALTIPIDAGLPADGVYDATALKDGPSLDDPFRVQFVWLGSGTPGAQPFVLFDANFDPLPGGLTTPVPEPSTWAFLAGALALFGLRRLKR